MRSAQAKLAENKGSPGVRARGSAARGDAIASLAFQLFIGLIIFTLLNIASRFPTIGIVRPTVLFVGLIAGLIIFSMSQRKGGDTSHTARYLNILILYILVTIPLVQWPGSVVRFGIEGFIKAVMFFYFAVYLVDSFRRLKIFIIAIVACQIVRILEPLYLNFTVGYWGSVAHMGDGDFMARLSGAPSDIINPNGLAFVILTAIPFLHYLFGASPSKAAKFLYALLLPALLYALVLTGSRSGMIGLVVVFGFIILRSRHRAVLCGLVPVVAIAMVSVMSDDLRDRYLSVGGGATRHGATAEGRLTGMKAELAVAMNRPIFGHGLGTSREALGNYSSRDQIAHNLYSETFIELGIVGLFLYLRVLKSILSSVRAVMPALEELGRRVKTAGDTEGYRRLDFLGRCAQGALAWIIMCLVFSFASYGLSEFYWYMIAGLSIALTNVLHEESARRA
jgi:putative inorganic carbon (hco3(-)) transporter